ncbi:hypothetical protein ACTG2V_22115 [Aeromonas sp. 74A]
MLARILSECGLREGHEYHTQVNIEVEKGKRYQPDVIDSCRREGQHHRRQAVADRLRALVQRR